MKIAFTIVLLVLLALAAFRVLPREEAHIARALPDFYAIDSSLKTYRMNAGFYPTTEQGLEALVSKPTTDPIPTKWTRIADAVPKDPWGKPYHYRLLSEEGKPPFEIISAGKDGILGTKDDRSSLNEPG